MAEHDDLGIDPLRHVPDLLDPRHAVVERQRRGRADGTRGRQAHVRDQDIGAGVGHLLCFVRVEDVRRGEQIEVVGGFNHGDFLVVAHACFLEVLPEGAVDEADGGEVLDAGEAEGFQVSEEGGDVAEGVGAADAGEDGGVGDDGEDFVSLLGS